MNDNFIDGATFGYDMDGDGIPDAVGYDLDGDGIEDTIGFDTDGDGVVDTFYADSNADGIVDAVFRDYDNDGIIDALFIDFEQDGVLDMFMVDTDGDGVFDIAETLSDQETFQSSLGSAMAGESQQLIGENGNVDVEVIRADFDGDTIFDDEIILKHQYGSHGELLSTNVIMHDGETDTFRTTEIYSYLDKDGDYIADEISYWRDLDNDGRMDYFARYNDRMEIINFEYLTDVYVNETRDIIAPTWSRYQDESSDPAKVVGNVDDIDNWIFQGNTPSCDICTQKAIIESLTGKPVDVNQLIDEAIELGVYSPSEGVNTLNLDMLLKTHGLETKMYFNATVEDIEECLSKGGRVLVGIDSDEIWYPEDASHYVSNEADHAVQVVGIDYTNEESPMVILNDSGNPHGAGEMIPLEHFVGAWEDSGFQIIEAYA